jgi:membrane-bound lytic murein transglycosylase A
MIAQDTGSAITGPARADLYFGAGPDAARLAGRLKNTIRFAILVPKALDPSPGARQVGLPEPRPSAVIAKLFPQTPATVQPPAAAAPAPAPAANGQAATAAAAPPADSKTPQPATTDKPAPDKPAATTSVATAVPLPQARPALPNDKPRTVRRRHRG